MYTYCLHVYNGVGCMTDESVTCTFRGIDKQLKERIDRHERANGELVNLAVREYLGPEEKATLKLEKQHLLDDIESMTGKIQDWQDQLEDRQQQLQRVEKRLEEVDEQESVNKEEQLRKLQMVPDDEDHPLVQEVAEELDMTPQEALTEADNL